MPSNEMTFRALRDKLATFTDAQLDAPVRWWGDERGGVVLRVDTLDEDHYRSDDYYEPVSGFTEVDLDEMRTDGTPMLPRGTPLLTVD